MGIKGKAGSVPVIQQHDAAFVDDGVDPIPWSAVDSDTTNVGTEVAHVLGSAAIKFDKSGVVGLVGGITRTGLNLDLSEFDGASVLELIIDVPSLTDVASLELRLGSDASNYAVFTFLDTDLTAGDVWDILTVALTSQLKATQVGDGLDLATLDYFELRVIFDLVGDTLADIIFDSLVFKAA